MFLNIFRLRVQWFFGFQIKVIVQFLLRVCLCQSYLFAYVAYVRADDPNPGDVTPPPLGKYISAIVAYISVY